MVAVVAGSIKFTMPDAGLEGRTPRPNLFMNSSHVVCHLTHHGRQTGDLMGIPPTGRTVAYDYVHFLRFRDRKVVEQWSVRDDMTLMRQLGVMPPRPAPEAVAAE